ncbi:MAG: hypothetical protein IJ197_10625 [Bacteroidaceae bacterium]|nr:hypothetical protein [Bacteroidaceae bacterium]
MRKTMLLLLLVIAQTAYCQIPYTARVVDAEDGEPLPMVGVYLSADHTTLTNFDGEFSIEAQPGDTLRLTCAGRRTMRLRCADLPDTIRMEMLPGVMSEVTAKAFEGILLQISRQMEKAFDRHRKKTAQYFYRQTSVMAQRQNIVEAFVDARSAVNLRDLQFVTGRHGRLTQQHWNNPIVFGSMNLHHVLELGAMTREAPFWQRLLTPLVGKEVNNYVALLENRRTQKTGQQRLMGYTYYQMLYDIDIRELDDEGRRIYRIDLSTREGLKVEQPIMVGTLYVDKKTLDVMAFDGRVEHMLIEFRRSELESPLRVPVNLDFHIDYRHDRKYPEVADLGMQIRFDRFQTRTMVFNVEGQKMAYKKKERAQARENMLASIDEAGYDSTFWANNEVIKRTAEEQRIAEGTIEQDLAKLDSVRNMRAAMPPLERLADRLQRFGDAVPQEKVYLHMDNRSYFLGDTIWFAAYTRKTNTDTPSRMSRVLYAELWNHDGYLVERKLVEMKDGRGSGFFALPDTLYSGFFELRAYTRWQLNWGQTEHYHVWSTEYWFYDKAMAKDFFRDYDKLYSRVFPVYDKPREAGDFAQDMTLRPLRRYFRSDPKPVEMRLSLFPEGGNLVAGAECRTAFEAATSEGEVVEGRLEVRDSHSQVVAKGHTLNRGRGTFVFTPQEGEKYEAHFTADDGRTVSQKISAVKAEGVSLQVRREGDTWQFHIRPQGEASRIPLGLTIMHEGMVQRFETLDGSTLNIQNSELPVGINQVTVFDSIGHIYADRLFFVTRPELARPTLAVSGQKEEYSPFEKIELDIKTLPIMGKGVERGSLSLAVRDAVHSDNTFDSGNIMTEMLLASEIKGFVPQPEWFFEQDDEVHRQGLDLLMMTQGWRRFSWQDMAITGAWELTHPAEHTQIVTGTVNRYWVSEDEAKDPFTSEEEEHEEFLLENGMTETDFFNLQTERMENRFEWNNPTMAGTASNLNALDGTPSNFRPHLNGLGNVNMAWNMRNVYENRERIGAIADTRGGVYSMQGRSWQQTDYNVLSFKQGREHSKGMKQREFLAMRRYLEQGNLKGEARVHAEFVNLYKPNDGLAGEVDTEKGKFKIDLPRFYGDYVFHLAASDTTKWNRGLLKKKKKNRPNYTHTWIALDTQTPYDKMAGRLPVLPEYYVRLNFPYPRWVKPYTYYQVHNAPLKETNDASLLTDGTQLLDQVTIRARRGGLRRLDYSKPAYVLDAYDAYNLAMDAGLIDHTTGMGNAAVGAAASLIGDMGMYRHYDVEMSQDSQYGKELGPIEGMRYDMLTYIDKIYIYTDYSPRREGDERYQQSNQPSVRIDLRKYPDNHQRVNYRDRRYIMHGFAFQEDFYHPDYQRNPPKEGQKDYRRTLYWNPDLQLDEQGEARITLFNNSQRTRIAVEAEGQTPDGTLLYNQ